MKQPVSRHLLDIAIDRLADKYGDPIRIRRMMANTIICQMLPCHPLTRLLHGQTTSFNGLTAQKRSALFYRISTLTLKKRQFSILNSPFSILNSSQSPSVRPEHPKPRYTASSRLRACRHFARIRCGILTARTSNPTRGGPRIVAAARRCGVPPRQQVVRWSVARLFR